MDRWDEPKQENNHDRTFTIMEVMESDQFIEKIVLFLNFRF